MENAAENARHAPIYIPLHLSKLKNCSFSRNFRKKIDKLLEMLDNFLQLFEFRAVQTCANRVDLEKCCKTSILSQKSASMQPRMGFLKFGTLGWKIGIEEFTVLNT